MPPSSNSKTTAATNENVPMTTNQGIPQSFPPPATQWFDKDGRIGQTARFFMLALFNRTGGPSGAPLSAQPLSGSTLDQDLNTVTAAGTYTLTPMQPGQYQVVFNKSGSPITIAAPSGQSIDGTGSYGLAAGKTQVFWCTGDTTIDSTQF
jgi:hypothetical protein